MNLKNDFIDTINKIDLKSILGRRFLLIVIMMVATLCMVVLNVSASISPDLVQEELEVGECYTVTKTVDIPPVPPKADVVFAFDLTGSMGDILSTAKSKAGEIMDTLIDSYPGVSFNFGVMSYMDYPHLYISNCGPPSNYGDPGDYAYSLDQPLTNSTTAVTTAINSLSLGSGGDGPEDYTRIFYESYADSNIGWRVGAKKLLVNFADNVPHDCNLNEGVSSGTWITGGDPGRDEIMFTSDDLDLQDVLASMNSSGVSLIECHTTSDYINYWNYWTGLTGGSVLITNSSNLVDDVVNAITSELTTPKLYDLHLEVITPGYGSWLDSVIPSSYPEVDTGTNVIFEETICVPIGTPPGYYTFIVSAVDGDGVDYGNQTNEITVINNPPVVSDIQDQTIAEGGSFAQVNLDDYVEDVEDPDEDIVWTHSGEVELIVDITNRIATITIPNPDWNGAETITFIAEDTGGLTDSDDATFTATADNDPPVVSDIPDQTIQEGQTFTTIVLDNYVTDTDNTDAEMTWTYSGNSELTVDIDEDRIATIIIPSPDWYGEEIITFRATDPGLLWDEDAATFNVTFVNNPPNTPSDPDPGDGETNVILNPTLSVYVSDPNGDTMNVSFYNADDDSLIGTASAVSSGSNTSVTWSGRSYSTTYSWYAIANDSLLNNKSDTWSFTTKEQSSPPSSSATNDPTADAGGPYYGFVDEEIEFDGTNSKDNDENGASIVQYDWKFFDGDTWHNGLGANPTHTYEAKGEYTVSLRVTDDEGSTATDTATVYITTSNNPPTQPTLDGPTFGHKQTPLDYDVVSTDLDNDTIRYIFDWGDNTNTTTEYFTNGTTATQNHSWPTYGNYLITVYAEDINNAISATTTYTVLIDVHLIDDEIKGDLIDPDSDDTWEVFYNDTTGNQTDVKKENDNYLIDSDGDGKWDHVYNLVEGLSTYFDYVYQKYLKIYTEADKTPGFEIISVLAMMALVLIILRRRR